MICKNALSIYNIYCVLVHCALKAEDRLCKQVRVDLIELDIEQYFNEANERYMDTDRGRQPKGIDSKE